MVAAQAESVARSDYVAGSVVLGWRWLRAQRGRSNWRKQDTRFAVATVLMAALNLYLVVANIGLVPLPLTSAPTAKALLVPAIATSPPTRLSAKLPVAAATLGTTVTAKVPPRSVGPPVKAPDKTPPHVVIETPNSSVVGSSGSATLDGTASDAASGVASVTVRFTNETGMVTDAKADLRCRDASYRSCTWSVTAPETVRVNDTAVATASDRAGNEAESAPVTFTAL